MRGSAPVAGWALVFVLALAGCESGPALEAESFAGGVLTLAHGGAGDQFLIFVNPDGSLAGAEGGEVEDFRLTRNGLSFTARTAGDGGPVAFDLPAAQVGPDFSGTYAVGGDCAANCSGPATAWWSQGHERVAIPTG